VNLRFYFLLLLCALGSGVLAQVLPDEISIRERKLGYDLFQGSMMIGNNRIRGLMADCPEALGHYDQGKRIENLGVLITAIGAVATGAAFGNYHYNGKTDAQRGMIIPGILLLGAGIPIYFSGEKKVKLGVGLYNQHCVKD